MIKRVCGLLLVFMLVSSMFIGCGSQKTESAQNSAPMDVAKADTKKADYAGEEPKMEAKPAEEAKAGENRSGNNGSITESGTSVQSVANAILAQRKIIRNANVTVEVDDFDVAYGKIKSMIEGFGFVQETNIKKEKIFVEGKEKLLTKGVIIVRVDKDKFESTMDGINGLGLVTEHAIKTDDVTEKFFDTESRLRLLRFEESRLEEYLRKLTDPDAIFKMENHLTDIRHEIEGLTGTLRKWSDLVQLSTITINISEKNDAVRNTSATKSYSDRLFGGFLGSLKGVADFFGELLVLIVSSLPILVVLGVLAWLGFVIYRKTLRGRRKKSDQFNKEENM